MNWLGMRRVWGKREMGRKFWSEARWKENIWDNMV